MREILDGETDISQDLELGSKDNMKSGPLGSSLSSLTQGWKAERNPRISDSSILRLAAIVLAAVVGFSAIAFGLSHSGIHPPKGAGPGREKAWVIARLHKLYPQMTTTTMDNNSIALISPTPTTSPAQQTVSYPKASSPSQAAIEALNASGDTNAQIVGTAQIGANEIYYVQSEGTNPSAGEVEVAKTSGGLYSAIEVTITGSHVISSRDISTTTQPGK
jgi:hypothetical protein